MGLLGNEFTQKYKKLMYTRYGSGHRTLSVLLPGLAKSGNKTAEGPRPDPYEIRFHLQRENNKMHHL